MSRARSRAIISKAEPVSEYASEVATAIHELAVSVDGLRAVGDMIAKGLFAIAAGQHAKDQPAQRDMTAVFYADAQSNYGDVWKKLPERERQRLECFIDDLCKRKR